MIRLYLSIIFSLFVSVSFAQKKEIQQARDNVKSGKNLEQVEKSMLKLLEDSANVYNPRIYRLLNASVQKQYVQLNEKMYLKQSVDSAAFFHTLNRAYNHAFRTDSIFPSERKQYANFLYTYLPNLYAGGIFLFQKGKYSEAYKLLDTYLECKHHPIFESHRKEIHHIKAASFRALCCGYRINDYAKTVKHRKQALLFKPGNMVAMKYLAETYQKSDSTYSKYIELLDSGFVKYPCEEYFLTRLLNHHLANQRLEEGLEIADKAILQCPDNVLYRYAKSNILLSMERFEECVVSVDSTLAISDTISDSYYLGGIANVYLAERLESVAAKSKVDKEKMLAYYSAALPYLEKYREREPERIDKWGSPLYNIYLNLNKGKEFEEIHKLLRNSSPKDENKPKTKGRKH